MSGTGVMILSSFLALMVTYILVTLYKHRKEVQRVSHIPGRNYPFKLLFILFHKNDFFWNDKKQYHNYNEFGPYWRITVGDKTIFHTCKLDHYKEIAITKTKYFEKDEEKFLEIQPCGPTNNVFASRGGESWKRYRSISSVSFTDSKLANYMTPINDIVKNVLTYVENNQKNEINHLDWIRIVLDDKEELPELSRRNFLAAQMVLMIPKTVIITLGRIIPAWLWKDVTDSSELFRTWPEYIKNLVLREKERLVENIENTGQASIDVDRDNFITQLLKYESPEYGKLSLDEVVSNTHIVLLAGSRTTGISSSWLIFFLAKHPQYQQKVFEEIQDFVNSSSFETRDSSSSLNLTLKDIDNNFEYLKMAMNETLRLQALERNRNGEAWKRYDRAYSASSTLLLLSKENPVPANLRKTVKDIVLEDGILLPKNLQVLTFHGLNNYDKKIWGEDADEFRPDRFTEYNKRIKEDNSLNNRFEFVPFFIGGRRCIGYKLAESQMIDYAANLVWNYEMSLSDEMQRTPIIERHAIAVEPSTPLMVRFKPRVLHQ
ncbi:predicted protein [Naegleria gruberi]|uniref:Predicted protein n=1 Tax=Naegleria gruberi TaxID=5762 RepID=D2VRU8_NAEGR|nr:uncharacterized protein NAEGRDRAFT_71710 [Naegleria gruberi]EFC40527.1 predicted protein [Naegleria gruberi]|eukprot:XP_002673271.1 predicted protein [Naegleria gruberi strain NEG-M]